MTEQQPEDALLSELLDLPEHADQPQTDDATIAQPLLTWREERALLRAANQAGTPTLAPELGDQELNGEKLTMKIYGGYGLKSIGLAQQHIKYISKHP